MPRPLSILLSEGSSTSARQTLYALGPLGYTIDICDPQRLCLGRFSRYVRRWHRCPPFAREPRAYIQFLHDQVSAGAYDVLLPVHDQVFLLARFRDTLAGHVGLALPDFAAVEQVQDKSAFSRILTELDIPQPDTQVIPAQALLTAVDRFPYWVKLPYSTAGRGVWRVKNREQLATVVQKIASLSLPDDAELVIQAPAAGTAHAAQTVFRHGELQATHFYRGCQLGVGGAAHARASVAQPEVIDYVARIGRRLNWHGAIHFEYFRDPPHGQPQFIEANPRIGETSNATRSGVNLCEALVQVSLGRHTIPSSAKSDVHTHALVVSLLGLAERGASRGQLLAELFRAIAGRGVYRGSKDELTRPLDDPWSLLPALAVGGELLLRPAAAKRIIGGAVDSYGLDSEAVERIRALDPATIGQAQTLIG